MKKSRAAAVAFLVFVLLLFPSCGGRQFAEQMTVERKDGGIVLNGLEWGAKKEQVVDAFGLAEGELLTGGFESVFSSQPASETEEQEKGTVQFFHFVPHKNLFGKEVSMIICRMQELSAYGADDQLRLEQLTLLIPYEDAAFQELKQALSQTCGQPAPGEIRMETVKGEQTPVTKQLDGDQAIWYGEKTLSSALSAQGLETLKQRTVSSLPEHVEKELFEKNWETRMEYTSLTTVLLDAEQDDERAYGARYIVLSFDGIPACLTTILE